MNADARPTDTIHPADTTHPTASIRRIVLDFLEIEDAELTDTGRFREEYNASSLTAIEIQAELEREFRIVLGNEQARRMVNLATTCNVVGEALAEARAPGQTTAAHHGQRASA
ncbi:acyl carrier protein [Streptomyces celluloflavus]|uniref:acyl carrier protein n=1 Tax=Streptomyces celluloflavus TaxID=58344 RepID=UPI0036557955